MKLLVKPNQFGGILVQIVTDDGSLLEGMSFKKFELTKPEETRIEVNFRVG